LKTYFECVPCIINQALTTLDLCGTTKSVKAATIRELLKNLENIDYKLSPCENTDIVYKLATKNTGVADPYYKLKKEHNKKALELYPQLENIVAGSSDRLYMSAKIAIAGNVIDLGISQNHADQMEYDKILKNILNLPLKIDDYPDFLKKLQASRSILYMADNAGEIVFDKIFISELSKIIKTVNVSVKSGPVINDANLDDAMETGIDKIASVIETGHDRIGNNPKFMSKAYLKIFNDSDLIICKGQGNFETLDMVKAPIYFLLKAKCKCIATELGVNYLDTVFAKSKNYRYKTR
jgi:damage-control phosphatase, subfamily I